MATIYTVSGVHTPNEGRVLFNNSILNINTGLEDISTTLGAVGGDVVGTTQAQALTNKTLVSATRSGGTNTITISRKDMEAAALFLVDGDSGTVSDIDVSQTTTYSLKIYGENGIDTYTTSNIFYIRNSEVCILNKTNQVLGVKVASVTSGNVAEFGGNILVNNFLAVGSGHSAAGNAEVHLKATTPELRIESTVDHAYFSITDGTNNFTWTADFSTNDLELRYDGSRIIDFTNSVVTLDKDVSFSKVGGSHTIVGDLDVQGILTAGGLIATATDVIINNGPVHISGGWSSIPDGAITHDKLYPLAPGYFVLGNGSSIPTAVSMTGAITMTSDGETSIGDGLVSLPKLTSQTNDTFLLGTGTGVAAKSLHGNSDITLVTSDSSTFTFGLKSNSILNADINTGANIDMSKTAFNVNVSGLVLNGNTLEFDSSVKADILYRYVPAGTIISYGGKLPVLSSSALEEPISGWFFCNGATYSTSTYGDLFTALDDTWGGVGKLPDLMGYFLRGLDPSDLVDPDINRVVGDAQVADFESHTHPFLDSYYPTDLSEYAAGGGGSALRRSVQSTISNVSDVTTATGGDETRPINKAVYYLIKY